MRLEQRERQQLAEALRRSCVSARRDELRRADNDRSALAAALAASRLEQLAFDLELEQALVVSQREHERLQRQLELALLEDQLGEAADDARRQRWLGGARRLLGCGGHDERAHRGGGKERRRATTEETSGPTSTPGGPTQRKDPSSVRRRE